MKNILIYTGPSCNFCDAAKRLLNRNNLDYKVIDVSKGPELRDEMIQKANGRRTIPQIFFNDEHIGGYQELRDLEKNDIISRKIYAEIPPRVEYSLTKKGKTLVPVFDMLNDWALDYIK